MPRHRLHDDPSRGQRQIALEGWTITTTKRPILSIPEADAQVPNPGITFPSKELTPPPRAARNQQRLEPTRPRPPRNLLRKQRAPSLARRDRFRPRVEHDRLAPRRPARPGVGHSPRCGSSQGRLRRRVDSRVSFGSCSSVIRFSESDRSPSPTCSQIATGSSTNLTVQKPFDWTYTTLHPGSTSTSDSSTGEHPPEWRPTPPTHPGIPLASLARTDIPILFFDEVPLFEDELGDNGIANATVRVVSRVIHSQRGSSRVAVSKEF